MTRMCVLMYRLYLKVLRMINPPQHMAPWAWVFLLWGAHTPDMSTCCSFRKYVHIVRVMCQWCTGDAAHGNTSQHGYALAMAWAQAHPTQLEHMSWHRAMTHAWPGPNLVSGEGSYFAFWSHIKNFRCGLKSSQTRFPMRIEVFS